MSKLFDKMAESDRRIIAWGDRSWHRAYKVEVPFWPMVWFVVSLIAWIIADAIWELTPISLLPLVVSFVGTLWRGRVEQRRKQEAERSG